MTAHARVAGGGGGGGSPTGPAGGDLAGSFPNPTIGAKKVTAAKVADDTITAQQVAADAIGVSELADNAVDTAAVAAGAVTVPKLSFDPATQAELDAEAVARVAADAGQQPLDSDLSALAALATTAFGRGLLELADAFALREIADMPTLTAYSPVDVGGTPIAITLTPDGAKAYVSDGSTDVLVYDPINGIVLGTVPCDMSPPINSLAVSPDGQFLYICNDNDPGTVNVIDVATDTTVTTIATPHTGPTAVAFAPDAATAYLACDDGHIDVVDVATHTVVSSIAIPAGSGIAVSSDGTVAVTADSDAGTATVVDIAGATILGTADLSLGGFVPHPMTVAITPDDAFALLPTTGLEQDYLAFVDLATYESVGGPNIGRSAQGVTIHPDGTKAFVLCVGGMEAYIGTPGAIYVVDIATKTVEAIVQIGALGPSGPQPTQAAFAPDGSVLYVTLQEPGQVTEVSPDTLLVGRQHTGPFTVVVPAGVSNLRVAND
jgi:DNA-binding beta-propeller fold protein YncE